MVVQQAGSLTSSTGVRLVVDTCDMPRDDEDQGHSMVSLARGARASSRVEMCAPPVPLSYDAGAVDISDWEQDKTSEIFECILYGYSTVSFI